MSVPLLRIFLKNLVDIFVTLEITNKIYSKIFNYLSRGAIKFKKNLLSFINMHEQNGGLMKNFINMQKPIFMLTASLTIGLIGSLTATSIHAQTNTQVSSAKMGLKLNAVAFVIADKLNLRSSANAIVGSLNRNDQVQILSLMDSKNSLVKIKVLKSNSASNSLAPELFVSAEYLSSSPASAAVGTSDKSRYIVIQNVATERTRIYERCTSAPGCANRLVMETEMVVGRDTKKANYLTRVGRYKITEWVKFYQDNADNYPSWYDPNYPATPKPGSSGSAWMSKKNMPDGKGNMRGAFGWYAGLIAPNADYQWIHGTIGWGSDGTKFIEMTRNTLLNMFANPRSEGCTRLENRAVAYTRDLLPVGTEIVRVYAREGYRDVTRANYQNQILPKIWEYILTKEGVRKSGAATSEKNAVLARGVSPDLILEQGSYSVDQYPNAVPLKEDAGWQSRIKGKSGNTYDVKDDAFRGYYLVDDGTFIDYEHPEGVQVGGYEGPAVPEALKTSGGFTIADKKNK